MANRNKSALRRGRNYWWSLLLLLVIVVAIGSVQGQERGQGQHPFAYLSPVPDARWIPVGTTLAVRAADLPGKSLAEGLTFSVNGSVSGEHRGEQILADDNETVLFKPFQEFAAGEVVHVSLDYGSDSFDYTFQTGQQTTENLAGDELAPAKAWLGWPHTADFARTMAAPEPFRTAPPDLPRFEVVKGSGAPAEGYVFMSPFSFGQVGRQAAYLLILDNNGEPVYYHRFERLPNAMDFKRHEDGQLTYYNRIKHEFIALNQSYEEIGSYAAGNGYAADLHDLQLLDNGHYLILIYDRQIVDMSQIYPGGNPQASVIACVIQELDGSGNVVFQWRAWDHIDILDGDSDFTDAQINFMNCNSIERDIDGHLILSSRNMDEITKINRQTGEIIWRMGGKKNEFTFINDNGFSRQHDARRQDSGLMTFYDNGVKNVPPRSRGVEVAVDETNKTVTVIREFHDTPDNYAVAMGNVQRLSNGNTVIGWGASFQPVYTEFDSQGNKLLAFNALDPVASYRSFRFPWQGSPPWPPALIAQVDGQDVNLYFSWNGSTETSAYMIFAAPEHGGEAHIANVAREGFENDFQFEVPWNGIWKFRVTPISNDNKPLKSSPVVTVLVGAQSTQYLPITVHQVQALGRQ